MYQYRLTKQSTYYAAITSQSIIIISLVFRRALNLHGSWVPDSNYLVGWSRLSPLCKGNCSVAQRDKRRDLPGQNTVTGLILHYIHKTTIINHHLSHDDMCDAWTILTSPSNWLLNGSGGGVIQPWTINRDQNICKETMLTRSQTNCLHLTNRSAVFLYGRSHGIRICIKRKKIHYGKFFDFCAEKCVYN